MMFDEGVVLGLATAPIWVPLLLLGLAGACEYAASALERMSDP